MVDIPETQIPIRKTGRSTVREGATATVYTGVHNFLNPTADYDVDFIFHCVPVFCRFTSGLLSFLMESASDGKAILTSRG